MLELFVDNVTTNVASYNPEPETLNMTDTDTNNVRTIRPGIFVNIKTSVEGNVSYQRFDITTGEKLPDGSEQSEWNTKKFVEDPEELERAVKVRGMARGMIEKLCTKTTLGLWCTPEQKPALDEMRDKAAEMVAEFNRTSQRTKIWMAVIPSRLESDDTRALNDNTREVGRLVQQMDTGIKEFDSEKIKEAAKEARELSSMLSDENKAKVNAAVEQARKAARTIVKRIEKEGEDRAIVMMDIQRGQIESARIAFLDMSEQTETSAEAMPSVAPQRFADLDVSDVDATCAPTKSVNTPTIDLEA